MQYSEGADDGSAGHKVCNRDVCTNGSDFRHLDPSPIAWQQNFRLP
jgi:hypothetical protein